MGLIRKNTSNARHSRLREPPGYRFGMGRALTSVVSRQAVGVLLNN